MTHSIKSLVINGREHEARGTFQFAKKAAKVYTSGDLVGYRGIYLGLINKEPEALSAFFQCAILTGFKEDVIDNAINQRIEENDGDYKPLFKGALEVMEYDMQLKGLVADFWEMMETQAVKADPEDRAEIEKHMETAKEQRDKILEKEQN